MQINLQKLKLFSILTCALLTSAWILLVFYIIINRVDLNYSKSVIADFSTILIIVFSIFFALGMLSAGFISYALSRKSQNSYINLIPMLLCIPAIISCNKYIKEWHSNKNDSISKEKIDNLTSDSPSSTSFFN